MAINPHDFDELITRVEVMTRLMSSDDHTRSQMKDEYYSKLKNNDYMLLKKAIDHILATHTVRTFPLLGEFFAALDAMRHSMATTVEDDEGSCIYCGGAGARIIPCTDELGVAMSYTFAKACTCSKGRMLGRNMRAAGIKYKGKNFKRRSV